MDNKSSFSPQHIGGYPPTSAPYPPTTTPYPPVNSQGYAPPPVNSQGYAPPPGNSQGYAPPPVGFGGYPPASPRSQPTSYPEPSGYPPPSGFSPPSNNFPQPPPGYHHVPQPVVTQPHPTGAGDQSGWMNIPIGIPNCPPGLEYLSTIDQLLVKQKVELLEAFTGFETNNKFTIKNSLGQKVYWAIEDNDCCTRNCCGPSRPFDMRIFDIYKNQVLHLNRPLACSSCLFPCCLQKMEVSAPPGNVIGSIEQEWTLCCPSFALKSQNGETVLRIEGPLFTSTCCGDVEFKVVTMNGDEVGKISKQWAGLVREMFTDADYFGINFPMDLDVRMKAVLLGACFLIDAMFFEEGNNSNNNIRHL